MIRAYLIAHVHAFQRACWRMLRQPWAALLSILVISIAASLPLGMYAVVNSIAPLAQRLNTDPHINIYLTVEASSAEARAIEDRLKTHALVRTAKLVSREEAFGQMKKAPNLAELLSSIDTNPLPHAFTVIPKATDSGTLQALRREFGTWPKVEFVIMDYEWAQKIARFSQVTERMLALLTLLLAVAVIFITGNTIRLQILTMRDEIGVSRLIGATRQFIRRPFLYFGAIQGFLAGLGALLIISLALLWLDTQVRALTITYNSDFSLYFIKQSDLLWVLAGSTLLSWSGSYVSVSLYLNQSGK